MWNRRRVISILLTDSFCHLWTQSWGVFQRMILLNKLGWALETFTDNFPCHQRMSVSNMYVKTSGRTWRIGGSQIWVRTGRDSILCWVCWTHAQKCSRSVTTSTSPHPGKTMTCNLTVVLRTCPFLLGPTPQQRSHLTTSLNQQKRRQRVWQTKIVGNRGSLSESSLLITSFTQITTRIPINIFEITSWLRSWQND